MASNTRIAKGAPKPSPVIDEPKLTSKSSQAQSKLHHRRSRSGCFTCRLRRKKCDESRPVCKACRHLGISCDYKRPTWWTNPERRRAQKEGMKDVIRQTKLHEKPSAQQKPTLTPPPSLCHSLPTSDTYSEHMARTTVPSPDPYYSPKHEYDGQREMFGSTPMMPPPLWTPAHAQGVTFSPFEVDIKTERQMFINDVPTRKDSMTSTFSSFQAPHSLQPTPVFSSEGWVHQEFFESHSESFAEEPVDFNFFDYTHDPVTPQRQAEIQVEECDKHLLDHFLDNVARLIFPVLDANQHGSARTDIILPALEQNKTYLHCCLSISALHLKVTEHIEGEQIDNDIMRHRVATITELCEAFKSNTNFAQILEATLGMIFFQSTVGTPDDGLPDIPWHQHFQGATDLLGKLESESPAVRHASTPFNMTLASWIDILGATMLGRVPVFADSYRQKVEAGVPSGLAELMGCDDRIMYVISEIACLEALRDQGMDDMVLCSHIANLGNALSNTESTPGEVSNVYSAATGALRPKQLSKNITAIFRFAARIYLCSLVPDFDKSQPSVRSLVESVTTAMSFVPAGPNGFDRCLVWPLLIAGSASQPDSSFRTSFSERMKELGDSSNFGSLGRVRELLHDVWKVNDASIEKGGKGNVHWRDVMREQQRDFLLL